MNTKGTLTPTDRLLKDLPERAYHHRVINDTRDLAHTIRAGRYAWPGGYEIIFVTEDGALATYDDVLSEYRNVFDSIHNDINDGYKVIGTTLMDEVTDGADLVTNWNGEIIYDPEQED